MGCHYTTVEYRWSLGDPSKSVTEDPINSDDPTGPAWSCLEKDVKYIGDPLEKKNSNNNYGKTKNALACQKLCQEKPGCGWFNWEYQGDCWLKKSKGEKENATGSFSGPRSCEEGEHLITKKNFIVNQKI